MYMYNMMVLTTSCIHVQSHIYYNTYKHCHEDGGCSDTVTEIRGAVDQSVLSSHICSGRACTHHPLWSHDNHMMWTHLDVGLCQCDHLSQQVLDVEVLQLIPLAGPLHRTAGTAWARAEHSTCTCLIYTVLYSIHVCVCALFSGSSD